MTHEVILVQVGIFAAMVTGILQILMLPMVGSMKKFIPRAALMASTAGIALTFLSMSFAFQVYENPSIAIGPLFLIVSMNLSVDMSKCHLINHCQN